MITQEDLKEIRQVIREELRRDRQVEKYNQPLCEDWPNACSHKKPRSHLLSQRKPL